uniref:Uncharacterized protein n=1 Tax=Anguilla anguilla TaxID=7936 RepID=A0A0E9RB38_ANGAN
MEQWMCSVQFCSSLLQWNCFAGQNMLCFSIYTILP